MAQVFQRTTTVNTKWIFPSLLTERMKQISSLLLVPSTQEHCKNNAEPAHFYLALSLRSCHRLDKSTTLKMMARGKNLWWRWAEDKKPHKSAELTHSNATQIILLLLLLMFHGPIYYCRVFSATQTISLADCIYQVLKSVLHECGTLWFQTHLITGCHLGTSITGIMRRNQTHSPALSLTMIQWYRRKCRKQQTFLYLLKNNF